MRRGLVVVMVLALVMVLFLVPLFLAMRALTAGSKPWASAIGNAHETSAMVRGEVLDKRGAEFSGEVVTVRLDANAVDLNSPREDQRSVALVEGDEIELYYSEGNYSEGKSYAFFIADGFEQLGYALYGHDLATDEPADEFDDNESHAGVAPIEVLDCLVELQGNEGDLRRLDAMVQAFVESHEPGVIEFSPALHTCEYPRSLTTRPASTVAPTTTQP